LERGPSGIEPPASLALNFAVNPPAVKVPPLAGRHNQPPSLGFAEITSAGLCREG